MDVSKNNGTPKWMVYNGNPLLKWMIWGGLPPLFLETSMCRYRKWDERYLDVFPRKVVPGTFRDESPVILHPKVEVNFVQ